MKTTKENRDKMRSYAVTDWHRDQMFSSKAVEAVLDDLDSLEARIAAATELLERAEEIARYARLNGIENTAGFFLDEYEKWKAGK